MSRAFSTMKTNVGNSVQDTSSTFATIIGVYINKRYQQILRRINWNYINEDYTVTTVAGTQDYVLATDFKNEVYCVDTTNNKKLTNIDLQDISNDSASLLSTQGEVTSYTIFNSDDGNKYLRLFEVPSAATTLALPYVVKPVALSADADENKLDIEDLIELGATADAWRYKRQFSKAMTMDALFEKELSEHIWEQTNQQNKVVQFKPETYSIDNLY